MKQFKNADELEKAVLNFIQDCVDDLQTESQQAVVEDLVSAIADDTQFADEANRIFERQGMTDEDGKPLTVENPAEALSRIDPKTGEKFTLSPEEDRWLRANKLYGDDVLKRLGFKYNNR